MRKRSRVFFRNPTAVTALVILLAIILFCIIYPFFSPFKYSDIIMEDHLQGPSQKHPLGTDNLGRDLLVRMAVGGQVTLSVAFLSGAIAAVFGTGIGIVCGYAGGRTDSLLMRAMDAISSIPALLLAIVFDYLLGNGHGYFLFGIAIAGIPPFARLVRGAALEISGSTYVEASRALGARHLQVVRKHVIRNVLPLAAVQAATAVADALTTCTVLGYISVSFKPPTPEWGMLFDGGAARLRVSPYLAIVPAAAIVICIVCFYLLGNGIRDSMSIRGGEA